MNNEVINKIYVFAYNYHKDDNTGHNFEHVRRVYNNVNMIIESIPEADDFICKASALLHDVDDHKLGTDGNVARRFLISLNIEESIIDKICDTINAISFSKSGANPNFSTIEMKVLSDADKLDAMGAIGICRTITYGTAKNRNLFNSEDLPKQENFKKHTINHFFEKLLLLKNAMQTEYGKKEAICRHEFMVSFLEHFFDEENCENWKKYLDEYRSAK